MSYDQENAGRGAALGAAYCFGLGLPFILIAFGISWVVSTFAFIRKRSRVIHKLGGCLLVIVGAMLVSGVWDGRVAWLRGVTAAFTAHS
jgi:cytochrome c-type biogenesis protein